MSVEQIGQINKEIKKILDKKNPNFDVQKISDLKQELEKHLGEKIDFFAVELKAIEKNVLSLASAIELSDQEEIIKKTKEIKRGFLYIEEKYKTIKNQKKEADPIESWADKVAPVLVKETEKNKTENKISEINFENETYKIGDEFFYQNNPNNKFKVVEIRKDLVGANGRTFNDLVLRNVDSNAKEIKVVQLRDVKKDLTRELNKKIKIQKKENLIEKQKPETETEDTNKTQKNLEKKYANADKIFVLFGGKSIKEFSPKDIKNGKINYKFIGKDGKEQKILLNVEELENFGNISTDRKSLEEKNNQKINNKISTKNNFDFSNPIKSTNMNNKENNNGEKKGSQKKPESKKVDKNNSPELEKKQLEKVRKVLKNEYADKYNISDDIVSEVWEKVKEQDPNYPKDIFNNKNQIIASFEEILSADVKKINEKKEAEFLVGKIEKIDFSDFDKLMTNENLKNIQDLVLNEGKKINNQKEIIKTIFNVLDNFQKISELFSKNEIYNFEKMKEKMDLLTEDKQNILIKAIKNVGKMENFLHQSDLFSGDINAESIQKVKNNLIEKLGKEISSQTENKEETKNEQENKQENKQQEEKIIIQSTEKETENIVEKNNKNIEQTESKKKSLEEKIEIINSYTRILKALNKLKISDVLSLTKMIDEEKNEDRKKELIQTKGAYFLVIKKLEESKIDYSDLKILEKQKKQFENELNSLDKTNKESFFSRIKNKVFSKENLEEKKEIEKANQEKAKTIGKTLAKVIYSSGTSATGIKFLTDSAGWLVGKAGKKFFDKDWGWGDIDQYSKNELKNSNVKKEMESTFSEFINEFQRFVILNTEINEKEKTEITEKDNQVKHEMRDKIKSLREKILNSPDLSDEERERFKKVLSEILRQNREKNENEEKKEKESIKNTIDVFVYNKISKMTILKDALNTALVASGQFALRGVVYALTSTIERSLKANREFKQKTILGDNFLIDKIGFILRDSLLNSTVESTRSLVGIGAKKESKTKKTDFIKAVGKIFTGLGIYGVAFGDTDISGAFDRLTENIKENGIFETVVDNFKDNLVRLEKIKDMPEKMWDSYKVKNLFLENLANNSLNIEFNKEKIEITLDNLKSVGDGYIVETNNGFVKISDLKLSSDNKITADFDICLSDGKVIASGKDLDLSTFQEETPAPETPKTSETVAQVSEKTADTNSSTTKEVVQEKTSTDSVKSEKPKTVEFPSNTNENTPKILATYEIKSGQGLSHAIYNFEKNPEFKEKIIEAVAKDNELKINDLSQGQKEKLFRDWKLEQFKRHGYEFGKTGEHYSQTLYKGAKINLVWEDGYPEIKIDANSIDKTAFFHDEKFREFSEKESPTKIIETPQAEKDNIENNSAQNKVAEKVFETKTSAKTDFDIDSVTEKSNKVLAYKTIIENKLVSNPEFKPYKEVFKKALSFVEKDLAKLKILAEKNPELGSDNYAGRVKDLEQTILSLVSEETPQNINNQIKELWAIDSAINSDVKILDKNLGLNIDDNKFNEIKATLEKNNEKISGVVDQSLKLKNFSKINDNLETAEVDKKDFDIKKPEIPESSSKFSKEDFNYETLNDLKKDETNQNPFKNIKNYDFVPKDKPKTDMDNLASVYDGSKAFEEQNIPDYKTGSVSAQDNPSLKNFQKNNLEASEIENIKTRGTKVDTNLAQRMNVDKTLEGINSPSEANENNLGLKNFGKNTVGNEVENIGEMETETSGLGKKLPDSKVDKIVAENSGVLRTQNNQVFEKQDIPKSENVNLSDQNDSQNLRSFANIDSGEAQDIGKMATNRAGLGQDISKKMMMDKTLEEVGSPSEADENNLGLKNFGQSVSEETQKIGNLETNTQGLDQKLPDSKLDKMMAQNTGVAGAIKNDEAFVSREIPKTTGQTSSGAETNVGKLNSFGKSFEDDALVGEEEIEVNTDEAYEQVLPKKEVNYYNLDDLGKEEINEKVSEMIDKNKNLKKILDEVVKKVKMKSELFNSKISDQEINEKDYFEGVKFVEIPARTLKSFAPDLSTNEATAAIVDGLLERTSVDSPYYKHLQDSKLAYLYKAYADKLEKFSGNEAKVKFLREAAKKLILGK
ncbi:MAG: hypothetical protein WC414_01020 [Patescibacteria group bacterium]